jgi:hypothetical protein
MNIDDCINLLEQGKVNKFRELLKICEVYFGKYRIKGSHHIFKTPWQGDPRINLQKGKGNSAKPYQVKQALEALHKLKHLEKETAKNE